MVQTSPIRIFAATHNQVTVWGLKSLLEASQKPMTWAGSHPMDPLLLAEIQRRKPDIVVSDAELVGKFLDLPTQLQEMGVGLLMLCPSRDLKIQENLVRSGARGVVHMGEPVGTLLNAIEQVAGSRLWMDPELANRMLYKAIGGPLAPKASAEEIRIAQLTRRERHLIATLVRHPEAKAFTLGTMLEISEFTVRNHLSIIYRKLELRGRASLVMFANRNHLA
jgi:DNA-binding NarL/FixJ family response regulator